MFLRRTFTLAATAALASMAAPAFAQGTAANWPQRPITLVVGYAPGGQADMHARILAKGLSERLGQNVVIDYKPGAGTTIAGEYGARARPDGYTLLLAGGSMLTIAPHTYSSVRYRVDDFQTVSLTSLIPVGLIINPGVLPVKDFREFVAYAKANPGKVNYATTGPGGASHMLGELIKSRAGIDMVAVHYKGAGPALQDVLSGRVQAIVDSLPPHLPHIAQGKELGLAISTEKRLPGAPMVATFAEMGYPELGMGSWNGIVVPKGTPQAIVDKLHKAIVASVEAPEFQNRVTADAIVPVTNTPAEFDALIRRDHAVWGEVIRKIGGIKLD
jgi:tripartite-type tricarboxylate transporter receptor subunit TctC